LIRIARRSEPRPPPTPYIIPTRSVTVMNGDSTAPQEVPAERLGGGA